MPSRPPLVRRFSERATGVFASLVGLFKALGGGWEVTLAAASSYAAAA
jgi:hypothetical protein